MNYFEKATAVREQIVGDRRYFHTNAEVGLNTQRARDYILARLQQLNITAKPCGKGGVVAEIGQGGKTILLRADMDALPMAEDSGLEFACPTGTEAHCCGHDLHAAMLLTAAQLLKEREGELKGTVRLMFQPGEENFTGAKDMIANGVLEPKPDVALAYHVGAGRMPVGLFMYNNSGSAVMFSMDGFEIHIHGQGGHGAYPQMAVDPINIGVHIHLALQELIARECDPTKACVLTVGQFQAGSAPNIIPDTALLTGTIRTNDAEERRKLVRRLEEVSAAVAAVYGGTVQVEWTGGVPPLVCDKDVVNTMVGYMQELPIPGLMPYPGVTASASEDFALVAEHIPSAFIYLSAGFLDERGSYSAHNPKVLFNEDVLPLGAACMAHCAERWLEEHA